MRNSITRISVILLQRTQHASGAWAADLQLSAQDCFCDTRSPLPSRSPYFLPAPLTCSDTEPGCIAVGRASDGRRAASRSRQDTGRYRCSRRAGVRCARCGAAWRSGRPCSRAARRIPRPAGSDTHPADGWSHARPRFRLWRHPRRIGPPARPPATVPRIYILMSELYGVRTLHVNKSDTSRPWPMLSNVITLTNSTQPIKVFWPQHMGPSNMDGPNPWRQCWIQIWGSWASPFSATLSAVYWHSSSCKTFLHELKIVFSCSSNSNRDPACMETRYADCGVRSRPLADVDGQIFFWSVDWQRILVDENLILGEYIIFDKR